MDGWRGRNSRKHIRSAPTAFNPTKSREQDSSSEQMPMGTAAHRLSGAHFNGLFVHIVSEFLHLSPRAALQGALTQLPSSHGVSDG